MVFPMQSGCFSTLTVYVFPVCIYVYGSVHDTQIYPKYDHAHGVCVSCMCVYGSAHDIHTKQIVSSSNIVMMDNIDSSNIVVQTCSSNIVMMDNIDSSNIVVQTCSSNIVMMDNIDVSCRDFRMLISRCENDYHMTSSFKLILILHCS
jgi:hypothetical protein